MAIPTWNHRAMGAPYKLSEFHGSGKKIGKKMLAGHHSNG
jgi:hypothetical protein